MSSNWPPWLLAGGVKVGRVHLSLSGGRQYCDPVVGDAVDLRWVSIGGLALYRSTF